MPIIKVKLRKNKRKRAKREARKMERGIKRLISGGKKAVSSIYNLGDDLSKQI